MNHKYSIVFFFYSVLLAWTQTAYCQLPANVPVDALVGWYPFNGNADDQSGNNYDGKMYFTQFTQDRYGNTNAAVSFNGVNAYIDSNTEPLMARGLTVSCWFSTPFVSPELLGLVVARNPSAGATGLYLLNGQDYIQQVTNCLFDEKLTYRDSLPVSPKWHHFAATYDGQILRNFVDGRLVAEDSIQLDLCIQSSFHFGRDACCSKSYFNGNIDDIGIWTRALSEEEIRNLWLPAPPAATCLPDYVPEKGLVAFWPFCENTRDESGNGLHGTAGNNRFVTDRNGVSKAALEFDGIDDYVEIPHDPALNAMPMSISFWMKIRPGVPTGKILDKYCCSDWNGWNIEIVSNNGPTGQMHFEYLRGTCLGIFQTYCSSVPYPTFTAFDNAWHHFTFTLDSVQAVVYFDGKVAFTQAWTGAPSAITNTLPLNIGRYGTGNTSYLTGQLDDIGIWKRALTAQEVADLYYGDNPAYCSGSNVLNPAKTYKTISDVDGNVYPTVEIGTREWMAQNLRTTHFNDGTPLKVYPDAASWSSTSVPALTIYQLDTTLFCPYGLLYNGYAATDVKNICPTGWHVPSDQDWSLLVNTLGGPASASGKLKVPGTDYWVFPNTGASNSSGFSALPAGVAATDGSFDFLGSDALFWTSTSESGQSAYFRGLRQSASNQVLRDTEDKGNGFSIRCVKDQCSPVVTAFTFDVCANDFPFTFQSYTFNGPKTITDTVTGAGCDTILSITVNQLPLKTKTQVLNVCANEVPFTFGGYTFTGPATVVDTLPGTGCDTIRTIVVQLLPLNIATVTLDVCANDFPFTFGGHTFTGPGTITDIVPGPGCDTIRTIVVNELPLENTTVTIEVCANDFPYTFDDHLFAGPGTITDTLVGVGCDTVRTIVVNQLPLETKIITRDICANDFPYTSDGHLFAGPGTIVDTIPGTGCDTVRTIIVNELPLETTAVSFSVCANAFPATLLGYVFTGPGTLTDTIPGTGCDTVRTISVISLPSDNVAALAVTTIPVTGITPTGALCGGVISGNGCAAVVQRGVVWGTSPAPTLALSTQTNNGSGTGTYASVLQPLQPNTLYYVRAYASNTAGVVYGNTVTFTTPPQSNPVLTLYMDTLSAASASQVVVPVKVKNFNQLVSAQFTIKFNPAVLSFINWEQAGLDGVGPSSFGLTQTASGIVGFAWSQPNLQPVTKPDDHIIFALRFQVTGAGGSFSNLQFDNDPVVIEFVNQNFTVVPVYDLIPGRVNVLQDVVLSGRLTTETGAGVRSASVNVASATGVQSMQTGLDGLFSFVLPPSQAYTLAPTKNNDTVITNGVTTFDGLLIQRHILGFQNLASPYKIIAADVNRSETLTSMDVFLINSLVLGNSQGFPNGPLWAFVPDDHVFQDTLNPFPYPTQRTYTSFAGATNQDFIGMKLGDVNNSYNPAIARVKSAETVTFSVGSTEGKEKSRIKVPVKVGGFKNVASLQFSVQWDANVLQLEGIEDRGGEMTLNTGATQASRGQLNVNWIHPAALGTSLADGDILFYLIFDIVGNAGISSSVTLFSSQTTPIEIVNDQLEFMDTDIEKGSVTVSSSSGASDRQPEGLSVSVAPNPFAGTAWLRIVSDKGRTLHASITDLSGKSIAAEQLTVTAGEQTLSLSASLSPGMYMLHIRDVQQEGKILQLSLICTNQ